MFREELIRDVSIKNSCLMFQEELIFDVYSETDSISKMSEEERGGNSLAQFHTEILHLI